MHDPIVLIVMNAIPGLILLYALYLAFGRKSRRKGEYVRRGWKFGPFWGERGRFYEDDERR